MVDFRLCFFGRRLSIHHISEWIKIVFYHTRLLWFLSFFLILPTPEKFIWSILLPELYNNARFRTIVHNFLLKFSFIPTNTSLFILRSNDNRSCSLILLFLFSPNYSLKLEVFVPQKVSSMSKYYFQIDLQHERKLNFSLLFALKSFP